MTVDRSILERLGAQAAEEADALLAASPEPDSIALLSRVHARRRRATSVRRAAFAGAGVALAAAAALLLVRRSDVAPVAPPTASVALPAPTPGPVAVAPTGTPLAFADGTRITVKSGAIAGVREVRDHGATIALDRGTLDVAVVHTDSSRWEIVAGGFEVRVTGTAFEATFDPEKQALTVAMREGSVRVVGPCVDEPLPAPATKTFSCAAAPASTAPPLVASGGPSAVGPAAPPTPPSAVAAPAASTPATVESAEALSDRADAARLAGDGATARRLYGELRSSYPGTDMSARSAFLLGRLAESSGAGDDAARWYATARRERPAGGFAQEALGRELELEERRGNRARARELAAEYLRAFPSGPYRAYAASVAEAPR